MLFLGLLLKINVALLIFYLLYRFALRKLTFYNFNRIYLIAAILIATVLPLLQFNHSIHTKIQLWQTKFGLNTVSVIESLDNVTRWSWEELLQYVYWSGVLVMGALFLIQLSSLLALYFRTPRRDVMGYKVRLLPKEVASFSFFKTIFIDSESHNPQTLKAILEHENIHCKQWHSLDILLGEIKRIFCWFNPAAWLLLGAIRENLEFIADRKVLEQGIDARTYQYSLLSVQQYNNPHSITNNFNFSHLKLRITMMNKKKSSELHLVKYLLTVPLIAIASILTNHVQAQQQKKNEIINVVDNKSSPTIETNTHQQSNNPTQNGNPTAQIKEYNVTNEAIKLSDDPIVQQQIKDQLKADEKLALSILANSNVKIESKGQVLKITQPITLNMEIANPQHSRNETTNDFLYYVDGVKITDIDKIDRQNIAEIKILTSEKARAMFPEVKEGQNVILLYTKVGAKKSKTTIQSNNKEQMEIILYPNPDDGILKIDLPKNKSQDNYEILDLQGNKMSSGKLSKKNEIPTKNLQPGTYIIKMNTDGKVETMKFQVTP